MKLTFDEWIAQKPQSMNDNPYREEYVDSEGRRCTRFIRDLTPEEEAHMDLYIENFISRRPPTKGEIEYGIELGKKLGWE